MGHCHCGRFNIARVGTKNDIVPPCTNGNLMQNMFFHIKYYCWYFSSRLINIKFYCYMNWNDPCIIVILQQSILPILYDNDYTYLHPIVVWINVTKPVTKIIVEIIWLLAGSSSVMQRAGVRMKGIETIAPIIVK